MPNLCKKCNCKCVLVSEECIYDNTSITAQSKILYKNEHVFNKVHKLQLRQILGKDCLDGLCKARNQAITDAELNGTTWREEIDPKWLLILDNEDFQCMYATYIEYYLLAVGKGDWSGDGIVEIDRQIDGGGITRNLGAKDLASRKTNTFSIAKKFESLFLEEWDSLKNQFDCIEKKCTPCKEQHQYYIPKLGFAKSC